MQNLQVKIKKLNEFAVIPKYAKSGDAAVDLTALSKEVKKYPNQVVYGTGISIEIPEGYVGLLFPRSSICKTGLSLTNSVGVIDSGYRGEIKFVFTIEPFPREIYEVGDRIGQLMIIPYPRVEFQEVEELSNTERGTGGFGSSGS